MADKKQKLKQFITPKGVAVYPWLTKPDTKFNADGEYRVRLRVDGEAAQELIEALEAEAEGSYQAALKENKGKKLKRADLPFKEVVDDEGNETGEFEFNFKMKAKLTTKAGDVIEQKPKLFDAKGKETKASPYGGSVIKVAFQAVPFYTSLIGAGISLRLRAVQIIELVESSGGNASSYGFDEEDGYEADDEPASTFTASAEESADDPDF